MTNHVDLNRYQDFVYAVTSDASKDLDAMIARLKELDALHLANISLLMTGAAGLAAESGEFHEIVKKMVFQGKPLDEANIFHMKRELGDILFYWINSCRALGLDPNEVIQENINKLSARYPNGFEVERSEHRKANDI